MKGEPLVNFTLAIFRAISLSELLFQQRKGAKYSENEIKNDNFTVKLSFLFNSENSVIHSYLYNDLKYLFIM
jgi:hypothetical protein